MIESDVYSYLKSYSGLTALIGNRLYPLVLPQTATYYPAVAYQKISHSRKAFGSRIQSIRMQFSCFAKTYSEAKAVAEQIRLAFGEYHGQMGNTKVFLSYHENEVDLYESDTGLYNAPVDVRLEY